MPRQPARRPHTRARHHRPLLHRHLHLSPPPSPIAQLCRVFADVFFFLLFGIAGWLYILYKGQDEVYVLMPDGLEAERLFYAFRATLCCVFGAKCVHIAWIIRTQTQHDVFFIDWEQPKGGADDAETANADGSGGPGVSVWRSIFAANEWFKLQTERTVSLELNLVSLLFLLEGVGQLDYARLVPKTMGEPGVPYHLALRYALTVFIFLLLSLTQWLFRWALWNRFVRDKAWQFVDLLAVSNVSMIVLEERASGYYLHGKSVHSHADTGMLELHRNLKRETDALAPRRGLRPDSDVQSFEIYVSQGVRDMYDAAAAGANRAAAAKRGQAGRTDAKGRRRGFRNSPEDVLLKHAEVNNFLTSFINGSLERHKLEVRPKTYGENLIGKPPDELATAPGSTYFLEDPAGNFKRTLLAGHEFDLSLLNALTYALFDTFFENSYIAVFATYVLELLVRFARRELARLNIAKKTLMDDRFLL